MQVPAELKLTTPAAIEHTDDDEFAMVIVGASETSLSTDTVYVAPISGDAGGVERKVNNCEILFTVIV